MWSTLNVTVSVRHTWLGGCTVRTMRKKKVWFQDDANEAVVAPVVGSGGVYSQAVGFVSVRLAGIWLQSPWRCVHIWFTYEEIL
jgi:hypothetical protein